VPDVLIGDPMRLIQVLVNLAGNAIKFTEKGSVVLEAKLNADKRINFFVTDTGIGIPKDKLQSVFESFTQAHASDSRKYGGTGLGLTISRQFIELMGGKLEVESVVGSGTTFSFALELPEGRAENLTAGKDSEHIDGSILDGLKILLADDNEDNRTVARDTLLSKSKVEITEAVNGADALEKLSRQDFNLVLMDVQMPVMDGYEATRQIRNPDSAVRNHTIPVIALTASVIRSDLDKCRAAGMNDYVPKPFKTHQLISCIAKLANRELKFVETKSSIQVAIPIEGNGSTDLLYLSEFCEGDDIKIRKYINIFLSSAGSLVADLKAAVDENNFDEIASRLHGFKTKFVMMGMDEAKEIAMNVELGCRNDSSDKMRIIQDTSTIIELTEQAINQLTHYSNG
jgi:CheY-like chemotaxis protein/HPt (histidine-containing phosphotransfer) domain-containing protein